MDQARTVINKRINSNDNAGSVASLLGKWGYLDLAKADKMPLMDGQRYSDQQLCMLFGMPYEMLQPGTTFSNKEMATKNWVNNTIIPDCKQFDDELNRALLKAFQLEGKVCVGSDYNTLPELQDDLKDKVTALSLAPWLTYNEKRIQMGYDPLPDPMCDDLLIPTGLLPLDQLQTELDNMNSPTNSDYPDNGTDDSTTDE